MFREAPVRFINHLLAGEGWARERLRPFAGQHVSVECGPLRLGVAVESDGTVRACSPTEAASVHVSLPADTPWRFVLDRDSLLARTRISGNADFAEALAFLFRHLRWDVESDVAEVVGDIPARRLVQGGRAFLSWQQDAARRLTANLTEYATEETGVLPRSSHLAAFRAQVARLDEELRRLESRLSKAL